MADYYQEDPDSNLPQNFDEYHAEYGNKPGQPGWENLSSPERQWIKDGRSPYQSYTEEETDIMGRIHRQIRKGTPADIGGLEDLMNRYQMSPGIRQYLIKKVGRLFEGGPDYQDVYRAQKGKLDVAMREGERGIMERQSARGMLDSSATQARLGGLQGQYSGTLADLLMGTAQMQETARSSRMREGMGLMGLGLGWQESDIGNKQQLETLRNMLYMQDIGLQGSELQFLSEERGRENLYNLQSVSPWDPMTGLDPILALAQAGTQAYVASQTGGAAGGGGGGGE